MRKFIFLLAYFLSIQFLASQPTENKSIAQNFEFYARQFFQEKLFVHTDRSFYLTGDYLWFKIYSVDGSRHRPSELSKIVYIELLDHNSQPVLQAKILMHAGMGHGSLFIPASINSGRFVFRAYTRWMENFSPEFYFHKEVTIVNPFKSRDLNEKKLSIPGYDMQFFPEGGSLVVGMKSKVAFRLVDQSGRGIEFNGTVLNGSEEVVSIIKPLKFGMGNFEFTPHARETYRVVVRDPGGKVILTKALPQALVEGAVMALTKEGKESERLWVTVSVTPDFHSSLRMIVQTRGVIKIDELKSPENGTASFLIDRSVLDEGISQITIIHENRQPLCERLYFKRPAMDWKIIPSLNEKVFTSRSRVNLDIQVADRSGPVEANMSISVFKMDSIQGTEKVHIATSLLLTSDLPGRIESPEYYFTEDSLVDEAMDNLMLTHGWRRFLWKDILQSTTPVLKHAPEFRGHIILGKVINPITKDSVAGILTRLSIPGKHFKLVGSRSNWKGKVNFEIPELYGPNRIVVEPALPADSLYHIRILNPFSDQFARYNLEELTIAPSSEKLLLEKSLGMQMENIYFEKSRSRVIVPARDTLPFFHQADEIYYLDRYTRFATMEDVLREYVPGVFVFRKGNQFHLSVVDKGGRYSFREDPLVMIDGAPIASIDAMMRFDPLRVRKLEVVTRRYFHGPMTFSGIVSLSTYRGDFDKVSVIAETTSENYMGVEWEREYFSPRYETEEARSSRLPDFRNLLAWIPNAGTGKNGKYDTSFYTSDQPGKYFGVINGLSKEGRCGTSFFSFEVLARPR